MILKLLRISKKHLKSFQEAILSLCQKLRWIYEHVGYRKYQYSDGNNYRNGTKKKNVRSTYGEFQVDIPQDRNSTFDPKIVKKRQKDISEIDQKIINMYARGLTTRQISEQIEDIYGFESWYQNWDVLTPIFKFSLEVRKVIYTTNAIESLNNTYKKLNRQRTVYPSDKALLKVLYLSTMEATKKWSQPLRNLGKVHGEFSIMYEGRFED